MLYPNMGFISTPWNYEVKKYNNTLAERWLHERFIVASNEAFLLYCTMVLTSYVYLLCRPAPNQFTNLYGQLVRTHWSGALNHALYATNLQKIIVTVDIVCYETVRNCCNSTCVNGCIECSYRLLNRGFKRRLVMGGKLSSAKQASPSTAASPSIDKMLRARVGDRVIAEAPIAEIARVEGNVRTSTRPLPSTPCIR